MTSTLSSFRIGFGRIHLRLLSSMFSHTNVKWPPADEIDTSTDSARNRTANDDATNEQSKRSAWQYREPTRTSDVRQTRCLHTHTCTRTLINGRHECHGCDCDESYSVRTKERRRAMEREEEKNGFRQKWNEWRRAQCETNEATRDWVMEIESRANRNGKHFYFFRFISRKNKAIFSIRSLLVACFD